MKKTIIPIAAGVLFTAGSLVSCSSNKEHKEEEPEVDELIITEFVDEPDQHFYQALVDFDNLDYEKSASEIRKGVKYMHLIAAEADDEQYKPISESIDILNELADEIEQELVDSVEVLNTAFADAFLALSENRIELSESLILAEEHEKAGEALFNAAKHLQVASRYLGEEIKTDGNWTIRKAKQAGNALKKGSKEEYEKAKHALKYLKDQLKKLDDKLEGSVPM